MNKGSDYKSEKIVLNNLADFACMWGLPMFNLHATGRRLRDISCVAASRMQNLHALAAITVLKKPPGFFAMTLGE